MTDGIILNPGTGGSTVATDEIGGTHYQIMKVAFGAPDTATPVSPADPLPVSAAALPLPAGAATAANQTTGNTSLAAIANALAGTLGIAGSVTVTNLPGTQAVSVASLPLPTGAATAALQGTGNTTLASILTALGSPLQAGGSVSVSNFPATQAISAASLPLPTGAATAANQTSGNATLTAISGQLPATLGQKAMASSLPVTLASDQSALPITAASLPLPTGAATATAQATGNASLANIDADIGALSDAAAAANGTGDYSLIAAAKRALLNWANLLSRIPAALGQTTMAGSWPVALASDHGPLNVRTDNVLDSVTTTNSVTSAAVVVSVPTAGFQGGSFHVTSSGSATITYEQSNDGTNWVALIVETAINQTTTPNISTTTTGLFNFVSGAAFVRARVSAYTSGTVTVSLTQKRVMSSIVGVSLQASSAGIGNIGTATLYRVRYVNGATLQGAFQLSSSFTAA